MTKMHKKVLFILLISGNVLLSPTSAFGLDKYHKKIFDGNYLYPASLLNSKVESVHLSSIRRPVNLLFNCLTTRQCLQFFNCLTTRQCLQFTKVVNDAMSKAKQKVYARKLLSNMSEINRLLLQKHLEHDIKITATNQFARKIDLIDLSLFCHSPE